MTDESAPRYFEEDGVLRASVDDHLLTVYSAGRAPALYPLAAIVQARRTRLPGGPTAVALLLDDRPTSPGLTFRDPSVAEEFFGAILDVLEDRSG